MPLPADSARDLFKLSPVEEWTRDLCVKHQCGMWSEASQGRVADALENCGNPLLAEWHYLSMASEIWEGSKEHKRLTRLDTLFSP